MPAKNVSEGANRRRHNRLEVALPLVVRGRDAYGAAFEDSTASYNVSREGASFVTRRELLVGQSLELIIPHRPRPHEVSPRPDFETTGVVRRLISRTEGEWEVGIEFTGPRLRTWMPESA
ncbi:MAG TPA: PilZ domain-containing protein [Candidatus Xenobia bacterium]|nr:PilZ domain-containing protein [Candidatus Xenobia bacterium]